MLIRLKPEPSAVLGPLWYLVNVDESDDWIGHALLAVVVPCILSVVVWPSRWTAVLALLTVLVWVIPGCMEANLP
jgi:hypothetical protein